MPVGTASDLETQPGVWYSSEAGPDSPATETCLVFMNFGWHYSGTAKAKGMQHVKSFPMYVRQRLKNSNTFVAILHAINTYGRIPTDE